MFLMVRVDGRASLREMQALSDTYMVSGHTSHVSPRFRCQKCIEIPEAVEAGNRVPVKSHCKSVVGILASDTMPSMRMP